MLYCTQDDGTVIVLCFAELKGPVNDQFTLLSEIGRSHLLPTVGSAIQAFVAGSGVTRVDWNDQRAIA